MKTSPQFIRSLGVLSVVLFISPVSAFEGRITAQSTLAGRATPLLYTVGADHMRVESTDTTRPNPVNILDRRSGVLTLLFPNNLSFVRLKPAGEKAATPLPGTGPTNLPGLPAPLAPLELKPTGEKTNLLGFACQRYEIKQRGEILEVWATDQLPPFQNYLRNPPPHIPLWMLEERWSAMVAAKKLFPLRARLRFENGTERYRFEVQSITPQKLKDEDLKLFQPPEGYSEVKPL